MATINFTSFKEQKIPAVKKNMLGNTSTYSWIKRINQEVFALLPPNLRRIVEQLPLSYLEQLEEIRLRKGRSISFKLVDRDFTIDDGGQLCSLLSSGYRVTEEDLINTLQLISNCSVYALEEEFRRGFITIKGGHRVGIVGKAILTKGSIKTQKDFSSLNIRLAREVKGVANKIVPFLIDRTTNSINHVLIISPPGCGKTTMLRDLVRIISNGIPELDFSGVDVGVVDERSEIAACYQGLPQNDVGLRTDVLDGSPKAEGMVLMLRSMNPKVIATDEIGSLEDVAAIQEVINCGIKLVTTIHGYHLDDIYKRPALSSLLNNNFVGRFIVLGKSKGVGTVEGIYHQLHGKNMLHTSISGMKDGETSD
ncbi:MAG: stage III sporulation protein AA [Bacillota bacterium]|nr:stage III sporulation protein AA [Bacillota bacterium]